MLKKQGIHAMPAVTQICVSAEKIVNSQLRMFSAGICGFLTIEIINNDITQSRICSPV